MADLVIDAIQVVGTASATLVNIELTDGRGDPIVGYVDGTDQVLVLPTTVTTDANGQVTVDLIPNESILPGNSCYTVRIAGKSLLIQKSGAEQNLLEAVINDPGDLDPIGLDFLLKDNNLSDVTDAAQSRQNLGLGNSATLDVGQVAGTVAAGDDPRFDTIVTDHGDLTGLTDPDSHPASAISAIPTGFLTATDVQGSLTELEMGITDHIEDTVDAHDASAISVVPFATIESTDVQNALEEIFNEAAGGGGGTFDHTELINRDAADQHPASSVTNTPAGTIAATHVQDAINELDGDIQGHITDATDAHDASAISFVPFATVAATDVQAAIEEVYNEASGAPAAIDVSFTPAGDIAATNVQDAIEEVDAELHAHEADTVDAHDASAISFSPDAGIAATDAQGAIVEALADAKAYTDVHITDTTDAHLASAIGFTPTGDIIATTVQAAVAEVDAELHGHENDTTNAHAASAIGFTPSGRFTSTTAQTGIIEAYSDAIPFVGTSAPAGTPDTGNLWYDTDEASPSSIASQITFTPTGTIAATDVQAAIAEVASEYPSNGAWTAFTPTFSAGITAIGNATYTARYKMIGDKTVMVALRFVAGSTTTTNGSIVAFTLPVGSAVASGGGLAVANGLFVMGGIVIAGTTTINSATSAIFYRSTSASDCSLITMTGTHVGTSGIFGGTFIYEIA